MKDETSKKDPQDCKDLKFEGSFSGTFKEVRAELDSSRVQDLFKEKKSD